jgi:hypothetical protein
MHITLVYKMEAEKQQAQPKVAPTQPSPAQRSVAMIRRDAPIEDSLKELYDNIYKVTEQMVGSGSFQPMMLKALIPVIIKSVQTWSDAREEPYSGPQKQALAINLATHVLNDLQKRGIVDEATYNDIMIAVVTVGPMLIDFAVAAWKRVNEVAEDVAANGCTGCGKRNGCCIA